jgi:hypothetical protein
MNHPSNRAERRHHRARVIARRRFVFNYIWNSGSSNVGRRSNPLDRFFFADSPHWGQYAKWNMNCGAAICHAEKYFSAKRQRREAHKRVVRDWEREY